ncbi:MAG: hypothetical protein R6U17_02970 [Thermoplasmata archaeon]
MRDYALIFLAVLGFIILLSLGTSPIWSLVILSLVIVGYIGIKYPAGRSDWDNNKKETIYLILTLATMLLIIYLLYLVFTIITFPSLVVILIWGAAIGMALLFIFSVIYPKGVGSTY